MIKPTAVIAVIAIAAAGCSTTVNGHPATLTAHGKVDAATLLPRVFAAMNTATSFRIVGRGIDDGGSTLDFDIHFGAVSSAGTITENGQRIDIIDLPGHVYFKAPDSFWLSVIPASKRASGLKLVHDKWVTGPASNADFKQLASAFDRTALLKGAESGDPASDYTATGPTKVHGQQVYTLTDNNDNSTLQVPALGAPLPTIASDGGTGTATFSDWNVPFSPPPPPAADVFDAAGLLH